MKLRLNPMAQLIERAERRINFYRSVTPQDLAHERKRQLAQAVQAGGAPTDEFANAAVIEGITPQQLAALILEKEDTMMLRENDRRTLIVRARAATNPGELQKLFDEIQIPEHPADRNPQKVGAGL